MNEIQQELEDIIRRAARQTRQEKRATMAVMAGAILGLVWLGGVLHAYLAMPPTGQGSEHQQDRAWQSGGAYKPPGKAVPSSLEGV